MLIFEGIWVDDGEIFFHERVLLLVDVGVVARNGHGDVLGLDSSVNQTLDEAISVKSPTIDNTVVSPAAISESLHQWSIGMQVLVEIGVID
jgi:hypothetical protein